MSIFSDAGKLSEICMLESFLESNKSKINRKTIKLLKDYIEKRIKAIG